MTGLAVALGYACITGLAVTLGYACITGLAVTLGYACITGLAVTLGYACITGLAVTLGYAGITGLAVTLGYAGITGLAVTLGYAGLTALSLAMVRHHAQLFGRRPLSVTRIRVLRLVGGLLLGLSLMVAVAQSGWAVGTVVWLGAVSVAGLALAVLLGLRPRLALALGLVPVALVLAAIRLAAAPG